MKNLPQKLPYAETLDLIVKAQHGSMTARNAAITGNMRLVASIAERAAKAVGRPDLVDDLIMAGAMGTPNGYGLLYAVMHFDAARGVRFATYAHSFIRNAVNQQLASLLPDLGTYKIREKLTAIRKVAAELSGTAKRVVTPEEVHAELVRRGKRGIALSRVEYALQRPGRETHEEPSNGGEAEQVEAMDRSAAVSAMRVAAFEVLSCDARALLSRRYGGERLRGDERKAADAAEAKLRIALGV